MTTTVPSRTASPKSSVSLVTNSCLRLSRELGPREFVRRYLNSFYSLLLNNQKRFIDANPHLDVGDTMMRETKRRSHLTKQSHLETSEWDTRRYFHLKWSLLMIPLWFTIRSIDCLWQMHTMSSWPSTNLCLVTADRIRQDMWLHLRRRGWERRFLSSTTWWSRPMISRYTSIKSTCVKGHPEFSSQDRLWKTLILVAYSSRTSSNSSQLTDSDRQLVVMSLTKNVIP